MATYNVDRPENVDGEDFSNYFSAYGFLYNQKEMLEDPHRMASYYNAILGNKACFKDKVVLDVGTGSGILAVWAAQAGAKKVYAVEATYMAKHAEKTAVANGFGDVIDVIQATMEEAELPEKVDIIVSEWMGYFLLRESMLDSVIIARDKWLKPDGAMYPSHATLYVAPIFDFTDDRRALEHDTALDNWGHFTEDLERKYGVKFGCLDASYKEECKQYFYQSALWVDSHPSQMLADRTAVKEFDILTLTLDELKSNHGGSVKTQMRMTPVAVENCHNAINGVLGWFDADFRGCPSNPAPKPVTLTTEPTTEGATHWGQQQFHINPAIAVNNDDTLSIDWEIRRQKQNPRLLEVTYKLEVEAAATGAKSAAALHHFKVD